VRDDAVYLRHIAESIALVEHYLTGADGALSQDLFYDDRRTQDAVLRRMETLADAATTSPTRSRRAILRFRGVRSVTSATSSLTATPTSASSACGARSLLTYPPSRSP
jgi:hypothetical protein